jgi:aminoglycoside 2''-phosphotransferase
MTQAEVKEAILHHCPQWKVESLRFLDEGDFCWGYAVNDLWVFLFAKHDVARQSLQREACLLPQLADQLPLPIPSPQLINLNDTAESPFIAYPLLPGPALTQERYLRLDVFGRTRCAEQIAGFLTALHSHDLAPARACGVPIFDYAVQYADLLSRARMELYPRLAESERQFIEHVIGNYLESGATREFHPVLLHGDLSPDHVLFNKQEKEVSAIIDFGDMMIGDPAWDLVFIYEDYGLDFLSHVLTVYGKADHMALLSRLFQHYQIAAVDWTISARFRSDNEFAEGLEQIRLLRTQEEPQRQELFSTCR